ncbi:MAG: T9SS type A sorting domain-containing protein [Bacteroidetes bacterium]|nr:T9SS type A sorting domain-containing protein [Bacteroidota bacterium]
MKRSILNFALSSLLFLAATVQAQTYTHPTTGVQSTYNGACLVSTCSGTYYDNGGAGGNYAANVNNIYRTFCPNTAGRCLRATFTSFSMNDTYFLCFGPNSCCDYLQVLNGPAQNSPALYNNCTASPGTITSTDPSGCLTFRFVSDGSVQLAGWAATLSCVVCGGGPPGNNNSDCAFATPVCNNLVINDASSGPGIVAEGCSGCNTSEVYTNWYRIQIQTSGTLAFTIDPNQNSDDFDPVVYGPNVTCGALGSPIRCSYAASAGNGNTGLGNGAGDASEDVAGDQWVSTLNVTAGQIYYVLINGWSASSGSNGFALNWTGTASLNCSILPVELLDFAGNYESGMVDLNWSVAGEFGLKNYVLERKSTGKDWIDLAGYAANGNQSTYLFTDARPMPGPNQYRLRMIEQDGNIQYSHEVEVMVPETQRFTVWPNPATDELNVEVYDENGLVGDLVVVDELGQEVMRRHVQSASNLPVYEKLGLGELPAGIYFLRFGNQVKSFMKQ